MIIALDTNHKEFSNDIAEEIRLFFSDVDIVDLEEANDSDDKSPALIISAELLPCKDYVFARARVYSAGNALRSEYQHIPFSLSGTELEKKRYIKRNLKLSVFRALKKLNPDTYTPWGSLTGIRPTRLLRELEGKLGIDKAREQFLNEFDVEDEKYELAREINSVQEPYISGVQAHDADVYIGIPYCKTRCLYCSFLSGVRTKNTDMRGYIDALKRDISHGAQLLREKGFSVQHLYMGGGTPTVLNRDELYEVLYHAIDEYRLYDSSHEITVEAGRPDTIDNEKLSMLKELGVKRISINPQTMNARTLELIGRAHTPEEIEECFYTARKLGFIINMDVIACLPGEDENDLSYTLERLIKLSPDNLTVHTLALKRSSLLMRTIDDYPLPSHETARKMLETSYEKASLANYRPYYMYRQKYMRGNLENVGFSRPGYECAYNIDMMEETKSIMAHGAGAMTKRVFPGRDMRLERLPNPKDVATYINKLDTLFKARELLFS